MQIPLFTSVIARRPDSFRPFAFSALLRRLGHAFSSAGASAATRPRRFWISSSFFKRRSPSKVALMTLCGFVVRSDFVRMSWMPTDSRTARTGPPAMTPGARRGGLQQDAPGAVARR